MKKNIKLKDDGTAVFFQQMYLIISSGLPAYQGISIMLDDAQNKEIRELLNSIYEPMENGYPLYKALENTGAFPSYAIHMLKLGEETGRSEEILQSLVFYLVGEDSHLCRW